MLDIGWSELMVIGVLALLVVGPKELPGLFRTVGQYVGKARGMAREFQRSMEDAARDADGGALTQLRDAKRDFDKMAKLDFADQAKRSAESLTTPKPAAATASRPAETPAAAPATPTPPAAAEVEAATVAPEPSPAPATGTAKES